MTTPNDARYHAITPVMPPLPPELGGDAGMIYLAGVVPYHIHDGAMHVFVTRPQARKPDLPPPLFQIGKGTRMMKADGAWRDVTPADLPVTGPAEPLHVTALREAEEELGLMVESIVKPLVYFGAHHFRSATTGVGKTMALFFTEIAPDHAFAAPDATHGKTAERAWLPLPARADEMRPNHAKACLAFAQQDYATLFRRD